VEWTGSGSEATAASSASSITEITSGGKDALAKFFMAVAKKTAAQ
jgi:hypothetical protein